MARFVTHLKDAESVFELATFLGRACLTKERELQATKRLEPQGALLKALETSVRGSAPSIWAKTLNRPERLHLLLGQEMAELLAEADTYYPLDCLGVLRGLLGGPLLELFDDFEGQILLDNGMPVPFATRPVVKVIKPKATPFQKTLSANELLEGCGARIFEYPAEAHVSVYLDYSQRSRIDRLAWEEDERLPTIASIHPPECGDLQGRPIGNGQFFDAGPRHWDLEVVLELLQRAANLAKIAVLPELSLESPDALGEELNRAPGSYPPLVIAGSGHTRVNPGAEGEVRANECRIYLDGDEVCSYRKNKPYRAKELNGKPLESPLLEGLTDEPKAITVLSGKRTRLAVSICADINHLTNPAKLLAAGVNLLIVPSFTPQPGSFNGPIADLAARCQGVSVITNAPPNQAEIPFHLMVGVPRPAPEEQTAMFPNGSETEPPTQIAVIDPNEPLKKAVKWV